MPLLKKSPFPLVKPPQNLKDGEEVFVNRITKEIFRDYDDYIERQILYMGRLWTCSKTGRAGLTYEEALLSEQRALEELDTLPPALIEPALQFIHGSDKNLPTLVDGLHAHCKANFFKGEIVMAAVGKSHTPVEIVSKVESSNDGIGANGVETEPEQNGNGNGLQNQDEPVSNENGNDVEDAAMEDAPVEEEQTLPSGEYLVRVKDEDKEMTLPMTCLSRKKHVVLSKKILKKLVYDVADRPLANGPWIAKDAYLHKYDLPDLSDNSDISDTSSDDDDSAESSHGEEEPVFEEVDGRLVIQKKRKREEPALSGDADAQRAKKHRILQKLKRKAKKKRKDNNVAKAQLDKEKEKKRRQEERERKKLEKAMFPMEDLELEPQYCEGFPDPPEPRPLQLSPLERIGDVMMIWDFLQHFSKTIKLSKFGLEDFLKALETSGCNKMIHETMISLIHAVEKRFDQEESRKRRDMSYLSWPARLKEYFRTRWQNEIEELEDLSEDELEDPSPAAEFANRVARTGWHALEYPEKVQLLAELVNDALESEPIRAHMEQVLDARAALKRDKLDEERADRARVKELQEGKTTDENGEEIEKKLDSDDEEFLEEEEERKKRRDAQYERELLKHAVRTHPIGRDRYWNRYWFFPPMGKVFVERDMDEWRCFTATEEVEQIKKCLNPKGKREANMAKNLNRLEPKLLGCMKAEINAERQALADVAVRRSSRNVGSSTGSKEAYQSYVNRYNE